MSVENKYPKARGYRLIGLCAAALTLGCIVPLIALTNDTGTAKATLLTIELAGALALAYVFTFYLLKK